MTSRWNPEPLGDGAIRFSLPAGLDPRVLLGLTRSVPRVLDVVVTECHICVHFDPEQPPQDLVPTLESAIGSRPAGRERPCTIIRARYDGPDLEAVARFAGTTIETVVAMHTAREYAARVIGFMPGFAYLGDVDPRIAAPRLASPRARVPARSIGIAGARTGVYPFASPGGWNLIATALDFEAFTPSRGATLGIGDRVRFEPA